MAADAGWRQRQLIDMCFQDFLHSRRVVIAFSVLPGSGPGDLRQRLLEAANFFHGVVMHQ